MSNKVPKEWIPLQIKAFSRWVSEHLKGKSDTKVNDITTDLKDGVALVELAEILTGRQAPHKWAHKPTKNVQMVENCNLAIEMFQEDDVKFVSISGKDINDCKEIPILGLIWTLILHYSLNNNVGNKDSLISWANERTSKYANVNNFAPYDLSMCALLDSYVPDKIKFNTLNPNDSKHNSQLAKNVMEDLGIPVYVYPEDLDGEHHVDEKVLLTQLTSAKVSLDSQFSNIQNRSLQLNDKEINGENHKIIEDDTESDDDEIQTRNVPQQQPAFVPKTVDGDNSQYADRKFGLIMTLNESDYNEGQQMNEEDDVLLFGDDVDFAVTLEKDGKSFLNPAGAKLNLAHPDIERDVYQQFTFGKGSWNTVIDSYVRKGMVWDVADQDNLNPPSGTPFYLFPFHGRHNQHFVYKDGYIYAKQNGMVVTYVGGDVPFQMMPQNPSHKARQQFKIQLL